MRPPKMTRRTVPALVLAACITAACTLAAAQPVPPAAPGELIDVGGHSLHVFCQGEGSPTVILETGLGDGSTNFRSLQSRISRFTRVCAYDRAGYGWSQAGPEPRDADSLVMELETLLANAGIEGPYVMAGHSLGGVYALMFANRNPEQVAGVVLIDSSHPHQLDALQAVPEVIAAQDLEVQSMAGLIEAAEAGQLPAEAALPNAPPVLSTPLKQTWAQLLVQPKQLRAALAEYESLADSLAQADGDVDIGDIPLTILSRGIGMEGQLPAEALDALGLTPEVLDRFADTWNDLQEDLLSLSTNSKRVVAEDSTHYVYYDQPELVVAAVREMVSRAR